MIYLHILMPTAEVQDEPAVEGREDPSAATFEGRIDLRRRVEAADAPVTDQELGFEGSAWNKLGEKRREIGQRRPPMGSGEVPGDGLGTALSGAFPGRRTVSSELVRTRGIRLFN